jgi:hypothetical protein
MVYALQTVKAQRFNKRVSRTRNCIAWTQLGRLGKEASLNFVLVDLKVQASRQAGTLEIPQL